MGFSTWEFKFVWNMKYDRLVRRGNGHMYNISNYFRRSEPFFFPRPSSDRGPASLFRVITNDSKCIYMCTYDTMDQVNRSADCYTGKNDHAVIFTNVCPPQGPGPAVIRTYVCMYVLRTLLHTYHTYVLCM